MAGDVTATSIAELIDNGILAVNDGYRAKNSELSHHGLPFARAQNVNNGFHFEGADCFPLENLHKVRIKISEPGDVVFTSKGTVGRFAFVGHDTPRFVYAPQLCFWRVVNPERLYPRWLYYWMHSREFFIQFSGVAGQTDMAEYVSLRDQRRMHITIPPLKEQEAIACILGALDDKIELNRRMNRTLEATARAMIPARKLRACFATAASQAGVSDRLLKACLGHTGGDMLGNHYRRIDTEELRAVVVGIETAIFCLRRKDSGKNESEQAVNT
jgi:type I restriction enzyme S subunit